MTFRHLKIFLAVCRCSSMTKAARELYISQPSVSQAITELEQYYHVRLFERLNRSIVLTPAGEKLYLAATQITELSEQTKKELLDYETKGCIKIGASLTIGVSLLPKIAAEFQHQMPLTEVFSRVDNTSVLEKLILSGELDLGLVEGPIYSPHIIKEPLCDDELIFISSPNHPLAQRRIITKEDLDGQPFIIREETSGTRTIFETYMTSHDISWRIAGIHNNNQAIQQAVQANLGLACISKSLISQELSSGELIQLPVQPDGLKRKFHIIYHHDKFFNPALQIWKKITKEIALLCQTNITGFQ